MRSLLQLHPAPLMVLLHLAALVLVVHFTAAAGTSNGHLRQQPEQQHQWPPHVLYVNLDRSRDRRKYMEHYLQHEMGLQPGGFTRVAGVDARTMRHVESTNHLATHLRWCTGPGANKAAAEPAATTWEGTAVLEAGEAAAACTDVRLWTVPDVTDRLGVVGCGLSHVKAVAMAYAMGLEEALIMEDDVGMVQLASSQHDRPSESTAPSANGNVGLVWEYVRAMVDALPEDWALLQLFTTHDSRMLRLTDQHDGLAARGILWKERETCRSAYHDNTADTYVWGTGAYLISRRGMHRFLAQHFPQFLKTSTAGMAAARAFRGAFDLTRTTILPLSDLWLYDMRGAFVSTLSIFEQQQARFASEIGHSDDVTYQLKVQARRLEAMQGPGGLFDSELGPEERRLSVQKASAATAEAYSAEVRRRAAAAASAAKCCVLRLEYPSHGWPGERALLLQATQGGWRDRRWLVGTATERDGFYAHVREHLPDAEQLWRVALEGYFGRCAPHDSSAQATDHSTVSRAAEPTYWKVLSLEYGVLRERVMDAAAAFQA